MVLVLLLCLASPDVQWPAVRAAYQSDALEGSTLEEVAPGHLRLTLRGAEPIDAALFDSLLASLSPRLGRRSIILEVVGPNGEDLSAPPLPVSRIAELAALWRQTHRVKTSVRQVGEPVVGSLSGVRIGISAGHGITWDAGWGFQRGILLELREDLHTNEIVLRHLAPMLEGAGAEVVLVRDRTSYPERVLVDNDGTGTGGTYRDEGIWETGSSTGHDGTYRFAWTELGGTARAIWSLPIVRPAELPLYIWYRAGTNRSPAAAIQIEHAAGQSSVEIDQRILSSRWRYLGTFPFVPGAPATVTLSNAGDNDGTAVIADAVRLGGGFGFADFGAGPSGHLRWEQSASTYAVEEEVPSEANGGTNDVTVRPALALWQGVDLFVSVHTNAAGGRGTSSFVYSSAVPYPSFDPDRVTPLPSGTLEFQEAIHASLIETFRAIWLDDWNDRGMWGANFGELRPIHAAWQADSEVVVPATLVELAFHDNSADAVFLREDRYRRDAARALLRGIIRYVHRGAPVGAVTPPQPPSVLVAQQTATGVEITWQPSVDPVDSTAVSEWYDIEVSHDGWSFAPVARTVDPSFVFDGLSTCDNLVVRVVAGSAGGRGMPSRAVIARVQQTGPRLLWVDGVRRLRRSVHDDPKGPNSAARLIGDLSSVHAGGLRIETARAEAVSAGTVSLSDWDLLLWSTGATSSRDGSLTALEQQRIADYLTGGGALILSGSEIGWDLVQNGSVEDRTFFETVLHAEYLGDDGDTFQIEAASGWLSEVMPFAVDDGSGGSYRVEFPDILGEGQGGTAELRYDAGGVAALSYGTLFYAGFPLETIEADGARRGVLQALFNALLGEAQTPLCGVPYGEVSPDGEIDADGGVDAGDTDVAADGGGDSDEVRRSPRRGCGCAETSCAVFYVAIAALLRRRRPRAPSR